MAEDYFRNFVFSSLVSTAAKEAVLLAQNNTKKKIDQAAINIREKAENLIYPPKQLPSESRKELNIQHQQKVKQNQNFTKALQIDRQDRERKQKQRRQKALQKLLKSQTEHEQTRKQIEQRIANKKQEKLLLAQQKRQKRVQELTRMKEVSKENSKKALQSVPLYKKIQDKYTYQVLMPELEKKKAYLAKKRMMLQQVSLQELREHAKWHDGVISRTKQKNLRDRNQTSIQSRLYLSSIPKSQIHYKTLQQEKNRYIQQVQKQKHKKQLIEKKMQYSRLVKEMFQPSLDKSKATQMELLKHKSVVPKRNPPSNFTRDSSVQKLPKRTYKENPMVPKPEPRKDPVQVDYLAQRRKIRGKFASPQHHRIDWDQLASVPQEKRMERVRSVAQRMELRALQEESRLNIQGTTNLQSIRDAQQVSDMLIDSIKAKLSLLEPN